MTCYSIYRNKELGRLRGIFLIGSHQETRNAKILVSVHDARFT